MKSEAKRAVDVFLASCLIILLSPALAIVSVLVWTCIGSPVFFKQVRPGLGAKPFYLYKFRTMSNAVDLKGMPLPDEVRLTRMGKLLRALSLDELPQLFNVLKGEMSLVGPRPLLLEYLPLYSPTQARRHEVRPGITGWAQVNGRNAISWEQKFELDVWYVDHCSFWLDMKILWMTLMKVLRSEGVNQVNHATMSKFTGSGGGTSK